jgi:cbb3-type cytochrome oxidase subunit 1
MKASILSFRAAVLVALAGLIWGIVMGVTEDHSNASAHAHLNLLGWVSLFLFGTYYHLHPAIDRDRLASMQVWIWVVATISLVAGIALVNSGRTVGYPLNIVGSLTLVADMLLFGWLVFKTNRIEMPDRTAVAE